MQQKMWFMVALHYGVPLVSKYHVKTASILNVHENIHFTNINYQWIADIKAKQLRQSFHAIIFMFIFNSACIKKNTFYSYIYRKTSACMGTK